MVIDGTRQGMVHPAAGEGVPLELRLGDQRVGVWIDAQGLHFQSPSGVNVGVLSWEVAIAMALVPAGAQPRSQETRAA
jgi:hypothetical protein